MHSLTHEWFHLIQNLKKQNRRETPIFIYATLDAYNYVRNVCLLLSPAIVTIACDELTVRVGLSFRCNPENQILTEGNKGNEGGWMIDGPSCF